jgi:YfiH family protein
MNTAPQHLSAAWPDGWLLPDLRDATGLMPPGVLAGMTTRAGGTSLGPYASFNLGAHVGDAAEAVAANRLLAGQAFARAAVPPSAVPAGRLAELSPPSVPSVPAPWPVGWLNQVHGAHVHRLRATDFQGDAPWVPPQADGALTTEPGLVCAVMVADCLPILLAVRHGGGVAALHAGWRGLAGAGDMQGRGIVEAGVAALCEACGVPPSELVAWLGPCIGPTRFQVGADVLAAFGVGPADAMSHPLFHSDPSASPDAPDVPKWFADLAGLARHRLMGLGVSAIQGAQACTASDEARFFSFRRDPVTGRQAALIALAPV